MADWYVPGFRAGGPIRSIAHFAEHLEDRKDIYVFTTDRDLGDVAPYPGVETDRWLERSAHRVFYASPDNLRWSSISRMIRELKPDHIYLNSMFSRYMSVYPLMMQRLGLIDGSVLLAPRGMLMDSAMSVKGLRKRLYIAFLKVLGVPSRIVFQVTNERESNDVIKRFGPSARISRLDNLPCRQSAYCPPPAKVPGHLKLVFVGRCHPIKNLDLLLRAIGQVRSSVELTVLFTAEDAAYEAYCRELAAKLPGRHEVHFKEGTPNEQVEGVLKSSHVFTLPSRGENFGHSIFEALSVGRPVIISDQTPWRGLEALTAGWDVPIDDNQPLCECIEIAASMDDRGFSRWCEGAWALANKYLQNPRMREAYIEQFK